MVHQHAGFLSLPRPPAPACCYVARPPLRAVYHKAVEQVRKRPLAPPRKNMKIKNARALRLPGLFIVGRISIAPSARITGNLYTELVISISEVRDANREISICGSKRLSCVRIRSAFQVYPKQACIPQRIAPATSVGQIIADMVILADRHMQFFRRQKYMSLNGLERPSAGAQYKLKVIAEAKQFRLGIAVSDRHSSGHFSQAAVTSHG